MNAHTIEFIKEWRTKHGVSQKELANAAGFNRNTYASWETGHNKPSQKALWRLTQVICTWESRGYKVIRVKTTDGITIGQPIVYVRKDKAIKSGVDKIDIPVEIKVKRISILKRICLFICAYIRKIKGK